MSNIVEKILLNAEDYKFDAIEEKINKILSIKETSEINGLSLDDGELTAVKEFCYETLEGHEKIETIFSRVVNSYHAGSGAFATAGSCG